jgi:hypothetical protein
MNAQQTQNRDEFSNAMNTIRREASQRRAAVGNNGQTGMLTDNRDVFVFVDAKSSDKQPDANNNGNNVNSSVENQQPVCAGGQFIPVVPVRQCSPKNEHCVWAWIFFAVLAVVLLIIIFQYANKKWKWH